MEEVCPGVVPGQCWKACVLLQPVRASADAAFEFRRCHLRGLCDFLEKVFCLSPLFPSLPSVPRLLYGFRVKVPYFHVDAFASEIFRGNPAGVCLLREEVDAATLQRIAFENNLSETAFVLPQDEELLIRWFTPTTEVDLCGHATLAAAHVLVTEARCHAPIRFDSASGVLGVTAEGDRLVLDFPARPGKPVAGAGELAAALGAAPSEVFKAQDFLCVYDRADDVRALRPDMAALAALDARGVIATAPGEGCDFVSRFFAPGCGIPEDPVTGSAHCTLAPYWAARLGRETFYARQISARGGEIWCELAGDRVRIGGRCVTYLRGEISF